MDLFTGEEAILIYVGVDIESLEEFQRECKETPGFICRHQNDFSPMGKKGFRGYHTVAVVDVQSFGSKLWSQFKDSIDLLSADTVILLILPEIEEEALKHAHLVDDIVLKQGRYAERTIFAAKKLIERKKLVAAKEEAEKASIRNLRNFKKLIEHGPDGILVVDLSNKVLAANPVASEMLKKEKTEIIGSKLDFDFRPGYVQEICLGESNKNPLWVEVQTVDITWDGEPARLLHLKDISKYKIAQSKLEYFSKVLEALKKVSQISAEAKDVFEFLSRSVCILVEAGGYNSGLVILTDTDDSYKYFYKDRAFGEQEGVLASATLPECIELGETEGAVCLVDSLRCRGCGFICDSSAGSIVVGRLVSENNPIGWLMCRIPHTPGFVRDGVEIFHEVLKDIMVGIDAVKAKSKARELMKDLEQSEEKFRKAFEMSPLWLSITTLKGGMVLDINRSCAEGLGFEKDQIVGKSVYDLGVYGNIHERDKIIQALIKGSTPINCEMTIKTKHGEGVDLLVFATLLDVGKEKCVLSVMQDMRDRKRLEAELRQAQKMEALGRLAGGIAHDFNNALSVIMGYAEIMKQQIKDNSPLKEQIDGILGAVRRTSELTRKLLVFAKKHDVNPQLVNVDDFIERGLKLLRRLVGEDIDVKFIPGGRAKRIKIDPVLLDQVFINLAVNARDAIKGSGTITIKTHSIMLDEMFSMSRPDVRPGEYVCVEFSDTGEGMDPEIIEHIFEPFFTTKGEKGTGLGLSNVYAIVTQHGGFIDVFSKKGEGSTFKIYLPVEGEDVLASELADVICEVPFGSERIVIVEDDENFSKVLEKLLSECGYEVFAFDSPSKAIDYCSATPGRIDLLISDLVLPQMSGLELSEKIREIMPGIKCLFMTGYPKDVLQHRGIKVDEIEVLFKPFDLRTIAIKVREVLDRTDNAESQKEQEIN